MRLAELLLLWACVLLLLARGRGSYHCAGPLPAAGPLTSEAEPAHPAARGDDLLRRCYAVLDSPFVSRVGNAMTLGRIGVIGLALLTCVVAWLVRAA